MKSVVETNLSSGVLDYDVVPKFETSKLSSNTSVNDITSKKLSTQISRKYWHEHTVLGPRVAVMTCPNCLLPIESVVRYNEISLTHVAAACLFPLGLCALPYCTPYFRDAEHYCPMCSVYLGTSFARGGKSLNCCSTKPAES